MTFYIITALSIALLLLLWQSSNLISAVFGSPPIMMGRHTIIEALNLAKLKKGETFYYLGCGNGQVLIEAAKMGAKATGFEISPYYYLLTKIKIFFFKKTYHSNRSSVKSDTVCRNKLNITVYFRDIKNVNLLEADVVYCYLLPKILDKINFPKSQRIISIGFPIKKFKPTKTKIFKSHPIFLYKF